MTDSMAGSEPEKEKEMKLLTPMINGERGRLEVADEEFAAVQRDVVRKRGASMDVTDTRTGKRYHVRSAPCSAPRCQCDAVAEELGG